MKASLKGVFCIVLMGALHASAIGMTVLGDRPDRGSSSWLHAATGATMEMDGNVFYHSGTKRQIAPSCATVEGTVDLKTLSLSLEPTPIALAGGGTLTLYTDDVIRFQGRSSGDHVGAINYTVSGNDFFNDDSGLFHFYYHNVSGSFLGESPNNMKDVDTLFELQLWGNNWNGGDPDNGATVESCIGQRLGLALRLAGKIEDGGFSAGWLTTVLLGLTLSGLGVCYRRPNC